MSKVEELLAKYNHKGVDIIPLWELTAWDKRFNAVDKSMQKKVIKYKYYLAKDLDTLVDDTGDIRILYTNERVAYTSEDKCKGNICEGEIVAIPWGGTPTVKYYYGKFITGDNRIATSLDTNILNNKYLYYWMISQLGTIADFYRGAGIQHPSMISVLSMQIPLPHIKVQKEIVEILDSFTNLIDALNEELSLRQKQFEYYREKLLTFDDDVEKFIVTEVAQLKSGLTYKPSDVSDKGILVLRSSNIKNGFLSYDDNVFVKESTKISDRSIVRCNDILICVRNGSKKLVGKCAMIDKNADGMAFGAFMSVLRAKDINPKYLFYVWSSQIIQDKIKGDDAAPINQITSKDFNRLLIPVPKEQIQQSIVEKLDAFESLISSLKEEIALRQKQYEYYREKLLTFD